MESKYTAGPQLPPSMKKEEEGKVKSFGPALPPNFSSGSDGPNIRGAIGPSLPKEYLVPSTGEKQNNSDDNDSDSDDDVIGPCLPTHGDKDEVNHERIKEQFEARAKTMKEKLTGTGSEEKDLKRESWMLELPPEHGKNFGLGPRTFRAKTNDLGDRSIWTDTPADRERKRKEALDEKEKQPEVKKIKEPSPHELAMKKRVEEYNQNSRPQSLLEMHRDKQKKDPQTSNMRKPFDRDRDLAFHKSNPKEKEKFIKTAKEMNNKFSSGKFEDKFL